MCMAPGPSAAVPRRAFRLSVYNILGQEIRNLVNHYQEPGIYELRFDGSDVASGSYFYRLSQ